MIFLSGGTGLVGLHIIDEFIEQGVGVRAMARSPGAAERLRRRGAEPVSGTVEEAAAWGPAEGCQAIVHSAAIIVSREPWSRWQAVNVEGTRLAATTARRLGIPLVHISSIAVYGRDDHPVPDGSIDERYPQAPLPRGRFYPRTKRLAEEAVWREVEAGLRATVLRPCLVYGEGDRLFLPRLVGIARSGRFPLIGSGDRPLALVHARNVAQAVWAALSRPERPSRPYNVTSDEPITATELIQYLSLGLERPVRPIRIRATPAWALARAGDTLLRLVHPRLPGGLRSAVRFLEGGNPYSSRAAREELGWKPALSHCEGVPAAVRRLA